MDIYGWMDGMDGNGQTLMEVCWAKTTTLLSFWVENRKIKLVIRGKKVHLKSLFNVMKLTKNPFSPKNLSNSLLHQTHKLHSSIQTWRNTSAINQNNVSQPFLTQACTLLFSKQSGTPN